MKFSFLLRRLVDPLIDAFMIDKGYALQLPKGLQTKDYELWDEAFMESFKNISLQGSIRINSASFLATG